MCSRCPTVTAETYADSYEVGEVIDLGEIDRLELDNIRVLAAMRKRGLAPELVGGELVVVKTLDSGEAPQSFVTRGGF